MKFRIQYWLKSDLIQTEIQNRVFNNTTELRDWMKPRLDNAKMDGYTWTMLLDMRDTGNGHWTMFHSEKPILEIREKMERHPKYKPFVSQYHDEIKMLLNL